MDKEGSVIEKKLRGSGGYTIAKISDNEQRMANLGGPELFLAGIGRLETDRFVKYHCNKCEKDYQGAPNIQFENPNEDLGENIILVEKGEYKCKLCNYTIAQYRKFNEAKENNVVLQDNNHTDGKTGTKEEPPKKSASPDDQKTGTTPINDNSIISDLEIGYSPIEKIIGMSTYNNNAQLVGKISEIGLRKTSKGKVQFSFKITNLKNEIIEVEWDNVDKIGDIVLLHEKGIDDDTHSNKEKMDINKRLDKDHKICAHCNHKNDTESLFCEECGKKME